MMGAAALLAFGATVPIANWMIGNVGEFCLPDGPCMVTVAPGLAAPSGVLMVGAALVLRDLVQERMGLRPVLAAIGLGAILAALVAPPAWAIASAVAFLASELVDTAVFTVLRRRGVVLAVAASGLASALVDSVAFLGLAFGSLDFLAGQLVGKLWAVVVALPILLLMRRTA